MQGFEICQTFNLAVDSVPESDTQKMDLLFWKWKKAWEVKYEKHVESSFNVNEDHVLGDLWDWESFAEENYGLVLVA